MGRGFESFYPRHFPFGPFRSGSLYFCCRQQHFIAASGGINLSPINTFPAYTHYSPRLVARRLSRPYYPRRHLTVLQVCRLVPCCCRGRPSCSGLLSPTICRKSIVTVCFLLHGRVLCRSLYLLYLSPSWPAWSAPSSPSPVTSPPMMLPTR